MGRSLKPPEQRRNRHEPQRGEWVDLEPLEEPVLREYDPDWATTVVLTEDGAVEVPSGVRREMWEAWRRSPVTSQYGVEDVAAIEELGATFYRLPPAQRLAFMDKLGLTPKGKRDLRWRTPAEVATIEKQKPAAVRRLRVVNDAVAGS